jgi:hypothetical protein
MAAIATKLDTIAGLRPVAWPADAVNVPAAVVALPEPVEFDLTAGRGADRLTFPVYVMAGRASDRASAELIAGYMDGAGAGSVKGALEADPTLGGAVESTRVIRAEPDVITLGAIDYLSATFTVEVIA